MIQSRSFSTLWIKYWHFREYLSKIVTLTFSTLSKMVKHWHFRQSVTYQKLSNINIFDSLWLLFTEVLPIKNGYSDHFWLLIKNCQILTFSTFYYLSKMVKIWHFRQFITYQKWSKFDIFDSLLPIKNGWNLTFSTVWGQRFLLINLTFSSFKSVNEKKKKTS